MKYLFIAALTLLISTSCVTVNCETQCGKIDTRCKTQCEYEGRRGNYTGKAQGGN